MRKINLKPYDVEVQDGNETKMKPFLVKESIATMLFHPSLDLDGREVIKRDKLAKEIEEAGDEILLEEVDYSKIKLAFETVKGINRNAVILLERVFDAEIVEVEEKNKN
jgi:hypothetical protein